MLHLFYQNNHYESVISGYKIEGEKRAKSHSSQLSKKCKQEAETENEKSEDKINSILLALKIEQEKMKQLLQENDVKIENLIKKTKNLTKKNG